MDRAALYAERMSALGWSAYRLAQEIAAARDGEQTTQQIYSAVRKCLQDPQSSRAYINDQIVAALGGEQMIKWKRKP